MKYCYYYYFVWLCLGSLWFFFFFFLFNVIGLLKWVSIAVRRSYTSRALEGAASEALRLESSRSRLLRCCRCPALSVQHRERRTAPDPQRKTHQTTAEPLQPASSTSTRPTGKIIHRSLSNIQNNSGGITRECVCEHLTRTTAAALQALNVIKRDYYQRRFFCPLRWVYVSV